MKHARRSSAAYIVLLFIFASAIRPLGGLAESAVRELSGFNAVTFRNFVPLDSTNTVDPEFASFKRAIENSDVVGLGEGSHGTHEFFELKERLWQNLVAQGFRTLIIEGDWSEWLPMDDYINGAPGDPRALLIGQDFSIWRIAEGVLLLQWMRAYNEAHPNAPLHIVGMDMQEPEKTLALVSDYARKTLPASASLLDVAGKCYSSEARVGIVKIDAQEMQTCLSALESLREAIEHSSGSSVARQRALLAIGFLERSSGMFTRRRAGDTGINQRDATLAQNAAFIHDSLFSGQKVAIWAEDMHIAAEDAGVPGWKTMGSYLRDRYGDGYYAVDVVFHEGAVLAKTRVGLDVRPERVVIWPPDEDEVGGALGAPSAVIFINIRSIVPNSAFGQWLAAPHVQWAFGGIIDPELPGISGATKVVLSRAFDGIFALERSSPATPL